MKRLAGLLLILLLTGCAATPAFKSTRSAAEFTDWQLNGRIALTHGEQGWHASLLWLERAEGYQLKLSGPLGQGGFQLAGDEHGVVLMDAEGHSSFARDGDALLLQATGWHLPVVGMRYWVRGLPVPDTEASPAYDEAGHLSRLEQSGWTINYQRYQEVNGAAVPSKMQLSRDDVSVRLVIRQWQLGPSVATPR
ncbi:MAG: lipoprotein insertase outer membrane protein LolB [Pseudomonadota bacterium]